MNVKKQARDYDTFLLVSSDPLGFHTGQGGEPMPLRNCWEGRKERQIQLRGQAEADRPPREQVLGFWLRSYVWAGGAGS